MNCVNLVGTLASEPKAVSDTQTPCCTGRVCLEELGKDGQTYRVYVPLEAWGQAALTLGGLPVGTPLAISGKLKWKSWVKDGQKQGTLVVSCFTVEVLHEVPAQAARN
jgi:hypothetical protein